MRQYIEGITVALQQPRTRWLLLLAVALCVVFGAALWDQFWRDTTTRYVRADASLYVRVSIPKYYGTSQVEAGVATFLDNAQLPIDVHDIKRELAFVQYAVGTSSISQIIIRTDRLSKVEEKLRVSNYVFTRLSGEHLVVGLDGQIILPLQDQQVLKIKHSAGKLLMLYAAPQQLTSTNDYLTMLFFGTSTDPMMWYGKARRAATVVYPDKARQLPSARPLVGGSNAAVWSQSQFQLAPYVARMRELTQSRKWLYEPEISDALSQYTFSQVSLVAVPKTQNSVMGWVVADYDWQVKLGVGAEWTTEMQTALERMLASIVAFEIPQPATRRLSDGTTIAVIRSNPDAWQFKQGDNENERILEIADRNTRITMQRTNSEIVITNAKGYQWPNIDQSEYGQLPTWLLPNTAPWQYLKGFSSFTVDNSGVILY